MFRLLEVLVALAGWCCLLRAGTFLFLKRATRMYLLLVYGIKICIRKAWRVLVLLPSFQTLYTIPDHHWFVSERGKFERKTSIYIKRNQHQFISKRHRFQINICVGKQ